MGHIDRTGAERGGNLPSVAGPAAEGRVGSENQADRPQPVGVCLAVGRELVGADDMVRAIRD